MFENLRLPMAAMALTASFAGAAAAGECPPEHRLTTARELTAPPDVGATREVLQWVDISNWMNVDGLALRIRRLVVAPGGFVPLHYHNDRPAVDYIVEGEIVEHSSFCAVPIVHRAGDSGSDFGDFRGHWWVNETNAPVVLVSADVVPLELVNY